MLYIAILILSTVLSAFLIARISRARLFQRKHRLKEIEFEYDQLGRERFRLIEENKDLEREVKPFHLKLTCQGGCDNKDPEGGARKIFRG